MPQQFFSSDTRASCTSHNLDLRRTEEPIKENRVNATSPSSREAISTPLGHFPSTLNISNVTKKCTLEKNGTYEHISPGELSRVLLEQHFRANCICKFTNCNGPNRRRILTPQSLLEFSAEVIPLFHSHIILSGFCFRQTRRKCRARGISEIIDLQYMRRSMSRRVVKSWILLHR